MSKVWVWLLTMSGLEVAVATKALWAAEPPTKGCCQLMVPPKDSFKAYQGPSEPGPSCWS